MTVPPAHFDQMYAAAEDPWGLTARWYDRRKYELTVASLPSASYRRCFEPACSVGVLTELLAPRCDLLLATDISQEAVATTGRRLRDQPHVMVAQQQIPAEWPTGWFDLIVLSEIGYYLSPGDFEQVLRQSIDSLEPTGAIIAVHWRHQIEGCPVNGDAVHETIRHDPRLAVLAHHEEADFLLDVLVLPPVISIAAREGLLDPADPTDPVGTA